MSIYKGSQLIAANGAPGRNGTDGRPGTDGQDGQGIMIVNSHTELHNNINPGGTGEITNEATNSAWASVGGYRSKISAGQASIVFGYANELSQTQCASVFGYENQCSYVGQGGFITGYENIVNHIGQGSVVLGYGNTVSSSRQGITVLGMNNTENNIVSEGGIIAGYGVTPNSILPSLSYQRSGGAYESTDLIRIGLKKNSSEVGIRVRNDGCVGISGDLAFTAVDSSGHDIGRYTLGEIVEALQNAGIITPPNNT